MSNDSHRSIQFTGNTVDGEPEVAEQSLEAAMAARPDDPGAANGIQFRWTDGEKMRLQSGNELTRGQIEQDIMVRKVEDMRTQAQSLRQRGDIGKAEELENVVRYYEEELLPANKALLESLGAFNDDGGDNDFEESLEALEAVAEERRKESIKDRYR